VYFRVPFGCFNRFAFIVGAFRFQTPLNTELINADKTSEFNPWVLNHRQIWSSRLLPCRHLPPGLMRNLASGAAQSGTSVGFNGLHGHLK
jgi:hypothetical protein